MPEPRWPGLRGFSFVAVVKYAAEAPAHTAPIFTPMTMLRLCTLALVTCLMTLTGVGAAMARGQMAADGVICGTGESRVVLAADGLPLFDAEGEPVEAQALPCLDCVFGQIALIPDATPLRIETTSSVVVVTSPPVLSADLWRMGGMGRSPPRAA
jgi:hypothetical protein